jgi:dihydroorotate dehydrogenase electron transfer subunit
MSQGKLPAPTEMEELPPVPPGWITSDCRVIRNQALPGRRHYYAVVEVAKPDWEVGAGQFFMISPTSDGPTPLLRRPMSVARCWQEGGKTRIGFLYTVEGRGTRALAAEQESWALLGPLGRGFPTAGSGPKILIGGGRGVAPLVILAEQFAALGQPVVFLNGARNRSELCTPSDLEAGRFADGSIEESITEDGSAGARGRVLDLFSKDRVSDAVNDPRAVFYACGPHGLLEAVGEQAARRGRPAWVAVEAHMACGAGICRTCVIPRAEGSPVPRGASNSKYILACLDGPVVEASSVDWENAP